MNLSHGARHFLRREFIYTYITTKADVDYAIRNSRGKILERREVESSAAGLASRKAFLRSHTKFTKGKSSRINVRAIMGNNVVDEIDLEHGILRVRWAKCDLEFLRLSIYSERRVERNARGRREA